LKKRPGRLWLFFYGRARRGFPWLLVGVLVAVLAFGLLFAIPGGSDLSRTLGGVVLGLLLAGATAFVIAVAFFPRRRP
jgi:hypothetical protein